MECELFTGFVSNAGYGLTYDKETKKTVSAHRKAYKDFYGFLPSVVMHICDNPLCINPLHLMAGTQKENIEDCIKKGRKHSTKKLNSQQIAEIRNSSDSSRKLAIKYNVNQKTICNIKNYKYSY